MTINKRWFAFVLLAFLYACSHRTLNIASLQHAVVSGNINAAYTLLSANEEKWLKGKSKLLYYLDRGVAAHLKGKFDESIIYLKKADYYIEDAYKNYTDIAMSLFLNDKVKEYYGEDHEKILLHYYQIMNFLQIGNIENALVQSRRLKLELNRLQDRQKKLVSSGKSRYQRDAFAYLLIGLVHEAAGEWNDAYIAYKLAHDVYKNDYAILFGVETPQQLKEDLLRMCYILGFNSDLEFYEKEFGIKYNPSTIKRKNLVFFWNNGLSPIKIERSLNFTLIPDSRPGWVNFRNNDLGLFIPVYVGEERTKEGSSFNRVSFVKLSIPHYQERSLPFQTANLILDGNQTKLDLVQNISGISHKILQDRTLEEVGKTLLRLALRKAIEIESTDKDNKNSQIVGSLISLAGAIAEQADTRCWSFLPYSIAYARLELPSGTQKVLLKTESAFSSRNDTIHLASSDNFLQFQSFQSIHGSVSPNYYIK